VPSFTWRTIALGDVTGPQIYLVNNKSVKRNNTSQIN